MREIVRQTGMEMRWSSAASETSLELQSVRMSPEELESSVERLTAEEESSYGDG